MIKSILATLFILLFYQGHSQSITKTSSYTYNADGFVSEESYVNSNQETEISRSIYPNDLNPTCTSDPDVHALSNLVAKNIIDKPIETLHIIKDGNGNERVVSGDLILYLESVPYPRAKYSLETIVPLTGFMPVSIASCQLNYSPYYKLQETYDAYDNYGNLLQRTLKGGKKVSAIYGYKAAYCTAIVTNAGKDEIAYSSFENLDDKGNWVYNAANIASLSPQNGPSFSGTTMYQLSAGNINSSVLYVKPYIVSYWHKSGTVTVSSTSLGATQVKTGKTINGWTYEEQYIGSNWSYNSSVIVSGSGYIDELRLYPADARMETNTYLPGIGVSSTSDANSQFKFYEYDQMGRVSAILDQYKNVVKKMEYGIQSQD